jgi:4-carboxymuconolactone decarboxylase
MVGILAFVASTAQAQRRMDYPVSDAQLTQNQRDALRYYHEKRGMELRDGLWMDLLRVPATMKGLFDMRLYVQNEISFGDALSEFAELIILREWNQRNEFAGHAVIALWNGVQPEIIHAIAEGRYPSGMSSDQSVIYHFITELMHNRNVSDPTYAAMVKRFGDRGVIEAITLVSLYSSVAMVYNTLRQPVPSDWAPMPDFPQLQPVPLSEYAHSKREQFAAPIKPRPSVSSPGQK